MVKSPTAEQLREISAYYNLELSEANVESFLGLIDGAMVSYKRLDQLVEPAPLRRRVPISSARRA